jgi:hypothetical protein
MAAGYDRVARRFRDSSRRGGGAAQAWRYLAAFHLNYNNTPHTIHLDRPYKDLLGREQVHGDVQLAPFDVLILA